MKVILNQDVYNLGEEGDICDVKRGYARNFLLPKGLAVPHTKGNLAIFAQKADAIEKRKEEKRNAALDLSEKLKEVSIVLERPAGDTGKLFGSVNNAVIADELSKLGFDIPRKDIEVPEHTLKMVGDYEVKIKLYGKESAAIKVSISKLEKEAKKDA